MSEKLYVVRDRNGDFAECTHYMKDWGDGSWDIGEGVLRDKGSYMFGTSVHYGKGLNKDMVRRDDYNALMKLKFPFIKAGEQWVREGHGLIPIHDIRHCFNTDGYIHQFETHACWNNLEDDERGLRVGHFVWSRIAVLYGLKTKQEADIDRRFGFDFSADKSPRRDKCPECGQSPQYRRTCPECGQEIKDC